MVTERRHRAGLLLVLAPAAWTRWNRAPALRVAYLTDEIAVTEQLAPDAVESVSREGYRTLIDLRPDHEAAGQPSADQMARAAREQGVRFFYVPVQHGEIPERSVDQLAAALAQAPKPILMYCRSGRRAARTWSLVEASRPQGLDANAIMDAVRAANQSADDLRGAIERRIAQRGQGKS